MYSKLDFCSDVVRFIAHNVSSDELSLWAFTKIVTSEDLDDHINCQLRKLLFIEEEGYRISRKNILKICNDVLAQHIDEMLDE